MPDSLVVPLVWAAVLIPLLLWLGRRTERRMLAALDEHLAAGERERAALRAEIDRLLAAEEADSAARRAAWEAEQAALDAEAAGPAR